MYISILCRCFSEHSTVAHSLSLSFSHTQKQTHTYYSPYFKLMYHHNDFKYVILRKQRKHVIVQV